MLFPSHSNLSETLSSTSSCILHSLRLSPTSYHLQLVHLHHGSTIQSNRKVTCINMLNYSTNGFHTVKLTLHASSSGLATNQISSSRWLSVWSTCRLERIWQGGQTWWSRRHRWFSAKCRLSCRLGPKCTSNALWMGRFGIWRMKIWLRWGSKKFTGWDVEHISTPDMVGCKWTRRMVEIWRGKASFEE